MQLHIKLVLQLLPTPLLLKLSTLDEIRMKFTLFSHIKIYASIEFLILSFMPNNTRVQLNRLRTIS